MSGIQPLFLLSLPRSGSTLLQRMLGAHSAISTAAEPWLLVAPLYAMRHSGVYAEYSQKTSAKALEGFWQRLPHGRQDYLSEVGAMALRLYQKASDAGARYFLDKTPRYSLIIDELLETFPGAKTVFLWRNPLAVVASIVEAWFEGRWMPYRHKVDLFAGLDKLVTAYQRGPDGTVGVRYEDLVTDPRAVLQRILSCLELPWEDRVAWDLDGARVEGPVGDHGLRRYQTISRESIDRWKAGLASPVRRAWCRHYLDWIGDERLSAMGYDRHVLLEELEATPAARSTLVSDIWWTAKGLASLAVEPRILRHKLDRLRRPATIYIHT